MLSGRSEENAWRRRSCGVGVRGAGDARRARPRADLSAPGCRRRLRGRGLLAFLRLPEQGGQRAFPHARPLTASHSRAPPSPDWRYASAAVPVGSYLSTDIPFTGASAKRTVFLMRAPNTRSPKFSSRISIASLACSVRVSTIVGRMPAMSHVRIQVLADHRERVLELQQPTHRQILALHGDDHLVGRRQRVHRQESQRRRRIDADRSRNPRELRAAPCPASARGRSSSTSRSRRRRGRSRRTRRRSRGGG